MAPGVIGSAAFATCQSPLFCFQRSLIDFPIGRGGAAADWPDRARRRLFAAIDRSAWRNCGRGAFLQAGDVCRRGRAKCTFGRLRSNKCWSGLLRSNLTRPPPLPRLNIWRSNGADGGALSAEYKPAAGTSRETFSLTFCNAKCPHCDGEDAFQQLQLVSRLRLWSPADDTPVCDANTCWAARQSNAGLPSMCVCSRLSSVAPIGPAAVPPSRCSRFFTCHICHVGGSLLHAALNKQTICPLAPSLRALCFPSSRPHHLSSPAESVAAVLAPRYPLQAALCLRPRLRQNGPPAPPPAF